MASSTHLVTTFKRKNSCLQSNRLLSIQTTFDRLDSQLFYSNRLTNSSIRETALSDLGLQKLLLLVGKTLTKEQSHHMMNHWLDHCLDLISLGKFHFIVSDDTMMFWEEPSPMD